MRFPIHSDGWFSPWIKTIWNNFEAYTTYRTSILSCPVRGYFLCVRAEVVMHASVTLPTLILDEQGHAGLRSGVYIDTMQGAR